MNEDDVKRLQGGRAMDAEDMAGVPAPDRTVALFKAAPAMLAVLRRIFNYCPFCSAGAFCRAPFHGEIRAALAEVDGVRASGGASPAEGGHP